MSHVSAFLVVIDTNIWIRIFLGKHVRPPSQPYIDIADAFDAGEFIPVYCLQTFDELLYMVTESAEVARNYGIKPTVGGQFVGLIFAKCGREVVITGNVQLSSDPDDDAFAEAALVSGADFLVSDDKDLHEPAVVAALRTYGIRVLWSNEFRKELVNRRAAIAQADATPDPIS